MTKAERLEQLTSPGGPDFPLDDDVRAALQRFPGPMPHSVEQYLDLLPWPA